MPEEEEREKLAKVIKQWNNNRQDLFEISQPDEVSCLHTSNRVQTPYKLSVYIWFTFILYTTVSAKVLAVPLEVKLHLLP